MSSRAVISLGIIASIVLGYFCINYHLPNILQKETLKTKKAAKETNKTSQKPTFPIALKNLEENYSAEENSSQKENNITKKIREAVLEGEENETLKKASFEKNETNKSEEIFTLENEIKEKLLKTPIEFKFSSAILTKKSKKILKEIAKELKKLKDIQIEVAGYTDAKGNMYFNKDLSLKRAKSVRKFLIKEGIDKNIIKAVGYGESDFIYPKYDKRNRRVEIHIKRGN